MAPTPKTEPSQIQTQAQSQAQTHHLLYAIALSHCNEKACWALSYYRVPYTQQLLLPWLHILTLAPIVSQGLSTHESRDRESSPYSTPCLTISTSPYHHSSTLQESLHDSHDILVYLSTHYSTPQRPSLYLSCGPSNSSLVHSLEQKYDEIIGRSGRDFLYLEMTVMSKWHALLTFAMLGFRNGVGVLQSALWFGLSPLLGRMITGAMGIGREKYELAMRRCREVYGEASEMLQKSPYLAGDHLSAADISFAALSIFILGITHQEGYQLYSLPTKAWSPQGRAFQQELRATRAGQHVLRLFREERYFGAALPERRGGLGGLW